MASLEQRGESVRVVWRLGGGRDGAKQSCTFSGGTPEARLATAETAKRLIETRLHNVTRDEVYRAIVGDEGEPAQSVPTFRQWGQEWIARRRGLRDVEPGTLDRYESVLKNRAYPFFGGMRLTDIDREVIQTYAAWLGGNTVTRGRRSRRTKALVPISASTISHGFAVVRMCLGAAVPRWLPSNPAARQAGERKNSVGLPKQELFEAMFLTPVEVAILMRFCKPTIRDLVTVALRTGMRRGELMALEAQHVVFKRSGGATVLVRKTVKDNNTIGLPKSESGRRDVSVHRDAAELLREQVAGKRPTALVFPSPRGNRWPKTTLENHWARSVADARRCPHHLPPRLPQSANGRFPYWDNADVSTCDCEGVLR
jgi:integrase